MDSNSSSLSSPPPPAAAAAAAAADVAVGPQNDVVFVQKEKDKEGAAAPAAYLSLVDPFLVEALQNPRHRLTSESLFRKFSWNLGLIF